MVRRAGGNERLLLGRGNLSTLLTFNVADFRRYSDVITIESAADT